MIQYSNWGPSVRHHWYSGTLCSKRGHAFLLCSSYMRGSWKKHTRKCLQRVWSRSQHSRKLHAQTGRRLNDQCHTSWGSTGPLLEPHSQRHPVLAKTAWSTCHRCQLVSTWTSFPLLYQGCLWRATQWNMKNLVCHLWAVLHDQYYMTNIERRFLIYLEELNIYNPYSGVTNNQSESLNRVIKDL